MQYTHCFNDAQVNRPIQTAANLETEILCGILYTGNFIIIIFTAIWVPF